MEPRERNGQQDIDQSNIDHPDNGQTMVDETPIVALATPLARSALAVIRTSGAGSVDLLAEVFSRPDALRSAAGNSVHHGFLREDGRSLDEVMVAVYRAPHSYSGQESAEIFVHGSPAGIERCIDLLHRRGFRMAEPGEFTLRAFLNGKMDLTRAEAVHEIVSAQTATAHELALGRLGGSVERRINEIKSALVGVLAAIEVQLDYPEEDAGEATVPRDVIESAIDELDGLSATYRTGKLYQEGARVALAGRTNAGKSSLFNLFLREDRSIVSEVHGTTRDYIESRVALEGIPLRLFDTAGLREAVEAVESEGIRRSAMVIDSAAVVLYLVDGSCGISNEDRANIERYGTRPGFIPVWNKVDASTSPAPEGFVPLSTITGAGFDGLQERILNTIRKGAGPGDAEIVIDSVRQKNLIDRCAASLRLVVEGLGAAVPLDAIALDLQDSIGALGEITGEVTTEDVLDAMFGGFCVGK